MIIIIILSTYKGLCHTCVCSSLVLDEMEKQSTCELEVDAVAADILNRLEIQSKTPLDNLLRQWIGCGVVVLPIWIPFTGNMAHQAAVFRSHLMLLDQLFISSFCKKNVHTICPLNW